MANINLEVSILLVNYSDLLVLKGHIHGRRVFALNLYRPLDDIACKRAKRVGIGVEISERG